MKSGMDRVPEGYVGLDICGAYIKGNEFILLGDPDEQDNHNCDAMGCGTFEHVLIRCEIPEWQAAQHLRALDLPCTCARFANGSKVNPLSKCSGCFKSANQ